MAIDVSLREQMLASVDRLCRERIAPRAAEIDESDEFPRDLYAAAGELGVFGLWIPEDYGGIGPDMVTPLLISERIARDSASFSLSFSNCGDAATPIVIAGSEAVKREYLPAIASGEFIPVFALTEPGAGSDAASIVTRAERDDDSYIINGPQDVDHQRLGGRRLRDLRQDRRRRRPPRWSRPSSCHATRPASRSAATKRCSACAAAQPAS